MKKNQAETKKNITRQVPGWDKSRHLLQYACDRTRGVSKYERAFFFSSHMCYNRILCLTKKKVILVIINH